MKTRSIVARATLAAVYLGLAFFAYTTGKGHELFLDNAGGSSAAMVSVNGEKPLKVRVDGIRAAVVKGRGGHSLSVEYEDGRPSFAGGLSIPRGVDAGIVSVARLAAGSALTVTEAPSGTQER